MPGRRPRELVTGAATDWTYAAGWMAVRAMPEFAARNAFGAGARYAARRGGPEQLRKNLARVIGVAPKAVPDSLMRASLASYARYWREAFRLPTMDHRELTRRLDAGTQGQDNLDGGVGRGARRRVCIAAQRQLGHERAVAGADARHLRHRRGAAQARVAVPAFHRIPRGPGFRGAFRCPAAKDRPSRCCATACGTTGWCA